MGTVADPETLEKERGRQGGYEALDPLLGYPLTATGNVSNDCCS